MEFVRIEPGSFWMGSPEDEFGREPQEVLHRVTLTRPFYIGRYEVTQEEWLRVMGRSPSHFDECGPRCPVDTISYLDIEVFIERLVRQGGERLRLPTEAEWEYACRAGSEDPFLTGVTLTTDDANFDGNPPYPGAPAGVNRGEPTPVGSFAANAWGLHDMHGNTWEWVSDEHCAYSGDVTDPEGVCGGPLKVIRGGSFHYGPDSARCGLRYTHRPQDDGFSLGFRLARDEVSP